MSCAQPTRTPGGRPVFLSGQEYRVIFSCVYPDGKMVETFILFLEELDLDVGIVGLRRVPRGGLEGGSRDSSVFYLCGYGWVFIVRSNNQ